MPDVIRYVGITSGEVHRRIRKHCYEEKKNPHRWNWVLGLKARGLKPAGEALISGMSISEACQVEMEMISTLRGIGHPLTNISNGGLSPTVGRAVSESTRAKLRALNSGPMNPNFGKKRSAETRRKMSLSKLGKSTGPCPEHVKAYFRAIHKGKLNVGRVVSAETRAKMRAAKLGRKQSPETCAKRSLALIGNTNACK